MKHTSPITASAAEARKWLDYARKVFEHFGLTPYGDSAYTGTDKDIGRFAVWLMPNAIPYMGFMCFKNDRRLSFIFRKEGGVHTISAIWDERGYEPFMRGARLLEKMDLELLFEKERGLPLPKLP